GPNLVPETTERPSPQRFLMSVSRRSSRVCWLFSCAFLAAICSRPAQADEPDRPQVTVESWVVEVSLADKSRHVGGRSVGDLLSTGVNPKLQYQLINPKFISLADIGLTPDELVHELEIKKLGRVLTKSKLKLPSGQSGSFQVNDTTIDATATVHGEKAILNYRFDVTEADPRLRDKVTGAPGYRQR